MIPTGGADRICIRFQVLRWPAAGVIWVAKTDWAWVPAEFVARACGVGDQNRWVAGLPRGEPLLTS